MKVQELMDTEFNVREKQEEGETLEEAFEVRQELMKKDIRYVETELMRLKALVQEREQNRETIIARKVNEMVGSNPSLDW